MWKERREEMRFSRRKHRRNVRMMYRREDNNEIRENVGCARC